MKLLKKKDITRKVYAVESGFLLGYFLTVIKFDETQKRYQVLGCRLDQENPKALEIPEKDMIEGINKGLLTYVDTIKRPMYRECEKEYKLIKSTK
jgi:hypothetical protein